MMDMETRSLWSQITGECIMGKNEGKKLTQFPARHSTYAAFKRDYPNGVVLAKESKGSSGSRYESYFAESSKLGIFGRQDRFFRLPAKQKVLGVRHKHGETAVSLEYLQKHGHAILNNLTPPVLITYDTTDGTAAAFELPESETDKNIDISIARDTVWVGPNRSWNISTGRSTAESTSALSPVPVVTAFWFAWATFFPDTELIK